MSTLRVTVYGIDGSDAREIEEILSNLADVDEVKLRYRTHDSVFGTIHASVSTPFVKVAVRFIEVAATAIVGVEVQDVYRAGKIRVQKSLEAWRDERNKESKRERIRF